MSIIPPSGMSLYVHVPFCQTKCPYCDFNTYQGIESLVPSYLTALTTELRLWGQTLEHPRVNTVFFGGGTPSYLPDGGIARVMDAINSAFPVAGDAEITIEANPGDITEWSCRGWLNQGVNRLSIGVQSLDNGLLRLLGRRHDAQGAIQSFRNARAGGFSNVNLDLMYGLVNQTMEQWQETLGRLAALEPSHISLYALTLEEGTPLHRWVQQGELPEPDQDLAADMYHHARELLAGASYHHYEISNWARPGLASQHNLAYWLNRPYLGVGPGAHSCLGGYRFWDATSPRVYLERVQRWADICPQPLSGLDDDALAAIFPVGGHEGIGRDLAAAETMFLGLRLLDGMDLEGASARVGVDLAGKYREEIAESLELGLLEWEGSRLRLTRDTYLIANQVFTKFLG